MRLTASSVTPSRVCGLKPEVRRREHPGWMVTPSRVCGLKPQVRALPARPIARVRHTLAGVWIEAVMSPEITQFGLVTPSRVCGLKRHTIMRDSQDWTVTPSRVCGLKLELLHNQELVCVRHTLAGVWIEAGTSSESRRSEIVTPSRVCGLKHLSGISYLTILQSHPRGCVD